MWAPCPTRDSPGWRGCALSLHRAALAWRRPLRLARLLQRRLNLGRTPPEWAPGPTRASPGGEGPRPPLSRSALAWQRLRRLAAPPSAGGGPTPGRTPRELAPRPTRAPPGGEGLRPPLSRSALPGDALTAWPRLQRAGRRRAGPHASGPPARRSLRPVRRDCPASLGPCPATPLPPGAPSSARADAGPGQTPHDWPSGPIRRRASTVGEGPRPPRSRSALARRRLPRGQGRCRVRLCVRHRGNSRPGRAPGPRPLSWSCSP